MELQKATLTKLKRKQDPAAPDEPDGDPIPVQYNPASLRLSLSNQVEGGNTRGKQERQFAGNSSTELSFDLHFDTADEGTDDAPVSVRTRTALVEQFVVPGPPSSSERVAPPRVLFSWGGAQGFTIAGIISSLSLDFDLFAPSGVPLRAKVGISIKEQNARYELAVREQAQATAAAAAGSGPTSGAPGSQGAGGDRAAPALDGESLADFAARMGLDPSAWRGLSLGLEGTLALSAGAEISFSAGLSGGIGLGLSAGFEIGAGASLEASFGLEASASAGAGIGVAFGASAEASAGFALAAAGGVSAASEVVAILQSSAEQTQALASFGAPAISTLPAASLPAAVAQPSAPPSVPGLVAPKPPQARPALPEQVRTPLVNSGMPSRASQAAAPRAPAPPRADPRAQTFGRGVPLRPRIALPEGAGMAPISRQGSSPDAPPRSSDPGAAPWLALPADDAPRESADQAQAARRPEGLCGCLGGCAHRRRRSW